ncbi:MAG: hypothetical protein ACD_12C00405G0006 [uncultured bacterium]|nr:MAG: hypothetical protein ACD_12C00405G0006 [uncultured bacterium]
MRSKLNTKQLNRLSEFANNIGVVFFATIITPAFSKNMLDFSLIIVGLFLSFGSVVISLFLLKK